MSAALQTLRCALARSAGIDPARIADDTPLVASGLLTSLQAVELIDLAESLTGRPIDVTALGPECFRDLRAIGSHLLGLVDPAPLAAAPLRGDALALLRRFDALVADAAIEAGAIEERHDPLVPLDVLRRAGWLASFPHLAMTAAAVEPSRREDVAASERVLGADLQAPSFALPPATCHAVLGSRAGHAASELVTACGPCWRAEAAVEPLVRQRCFTMREIVRIGTPAEADAFVADWARRLPALAEALGLRASLQVASDPFFDPARDPKARAQALLGPVKRELVDDRGVALASVNLHRSFFAGAFGLRRDDGACWSACVAFGLERWTGALGSATGDWRAAAEALR